MVVHGKDAVCRNVQTVKRAKLQRLVDMVAPVGVEVDLLQKHQVCILRRSSLSDGVKILFQPFFGPCARLRAAVHEKAEVLFIRAETDVPAEDFIVRLWLGSLDAAASVCDAQLLVVFDARIRAEYIAHIAKHGDQHHQQQNSSNFQDSFQVLRLLFVLLFVSYPIACKNAIRLACAELQF